MNLYLAKYTYRETGYTFYLILANSIGDVIPTINKALSVGRKLQSTNLFENDRVQYRDIELVVNNISPNNIVDRYIWTVHGIIVKEIPVQIIPAKVTIGGI